MSIFVNLFICSEFYSKLKIYRLGYFVYNSNRPTGRFLDSGLGLWTNSQTVGKDRIIGVACTKLIF